MGDQAEQDVESSAAADVVRPADTLRDLIDAFDWAGSPLGAREHWPESLRTVVDIMLGSGHAMCLAWGPWLTLLYNDAYAPFLGARHPHALGKAFSDVWSDVWSDIGPLVERTFAGETVTFHDMPLVMTRNGYPEDTWWTFSYSPVRDEAGDVAGLLNVASDSGPRIVAERQRDAALAELAEREAFLSSVLAASTDCIKVVELDGTLSFMTEGGMQVMDIGDFNAVRGCPWPDLLKDGGVGQAREAIAAAARGQSSQFETPADTYIGTPKYWSVSVSPIAGPDGGVARILSVSRDITALRDAHERQQLLAGELGHRLKNVLTMIQSIASQTLRGATSMEDAAAALSSRLVSLGKATDVLTATSWQNADLHDVAAAGLSAVGGIGGRVTLDGPAIALRSEVALALTLALHELATNAVKYGALSNETGTVALEWHVEGEKDARRFKLLWRERGGPIVTPPTRQGFGSRMIERSLRSYFHGSTAIDYAREGVEFRVDAPLAATGELAGY